MDAQQRCEAVVDRRLDGADRGQHLLGPRDGLGMGHEAAVVELLRGRMAELDGVEETAHAPS